MNRAERRKELSQLWYSENEGWDGKSSITKIIEQEHGMIVEAEKKVLKDFAEELSFRLERLDCKSNKMCLQIIKAMLKTRGIEDD